MLKTGIDYWRTEIWPRRRRILMSSQLVLAVALGTSFAAWGDALAIGSSTVGDTLVVVLAYAAIAFGFCLAGLTVALTLPDREFAMELVAPRHGDADDGKGGEKTAYSHLMFVFSWTAVAHWVTIVGAFALLIGAGPDQPLLDPDASTPRHIALGALTAVLAYAVMQFLVTVITLSQVGEVYVALLREKGKSASKAGS